MTWLSTPLKPMKSLYVYGVSPTASSIQVPVAGSSRAAEFEPWQIAHTDPSNETPTPTGPSPVGIVCVATKPIVARSYCTMRQGVDPIVTLIFPGILLGRPALERHDHPAFEGPPRTCGHACPA